MALLVCLGTGYVGLAQLTDAVAGGCGQVTGTCGVTGETDHFHGVIAVTGAAWVLNLSTSSGTGCSDCIWSFVPACVTENQGSPDTLCDGSTLAPTCSPGQVLDRIYLSTGDSLDRDEGTICLGGDQQVVPVTDIGVADVARYLDNVTPPALRVTTRPGGATLAGLPTYFTAADPSDLQPSAFGGPDVTETITITPASVRWRWGEGSGTEWSAPDQRSSHTYTSGGIDRPVLATRWSASYTISYAGQTFGPYDANRQLTKTQTFRLPVLTSSPVLVSR